MEVVKNLISICESFDREELTQATRNSSNIFTTTKNIEMRLVKNYINEKV